MFRSGKSCHGVYGDAYSTISSAKAACNQDDDCEMIVDRTCNGRTFKFCKAPIIDSSIGSCVWNKGIFKVILHMYESNTFVVLACYIDMS